MAPKTLTSKISFSLAGVWERVSVGGVMPVPALLTDNKGLVVYSIE